MYERTNRPKKSIILGQLNWLHLIVQIILRVIDKKLVGSSGRLKLLSLNSNQTGIYLFKVYNINLRTRCEKCSDLTIETPRRCQWRRSGVFIVNFEHISHRVLVFLLLNLNRWLHTGKLDCRGTFFAFLAKTSMEIFAC